MSLGFDFRTQRHMWVCCWFSFLLQEFFPGFFGFPPSTKFSISKLQFDVETLDEQPLYGCADEIPIYFHLFYWTRTIRLARMVEIFFLFLSTRRQDTHIETCFMIQAAPRWMAVRLDMLSVTFTAAVAFIAIAAQSGPGE